MHQSADPVTIAVVDDDASMRLTCTKVLEKTGYVVETFPDGAHGLEGIGRLHPRLALVDLKMPGLSGLEVIARIREIEPHTVIVVITGYATIGTAVEAMKAGAFDFLPKPFSPDELRMIVTRALEHGRLRDASLQCELDRELMRRRFASFVSHQLKSPLAAVRQYLDLLARPTTGVSGSTDQAEWIHRCRLRANEMLQLIEDWLTLARMEGGQISRERVPVDLCEVVKGVLAAYREPARDKSVDLVTVLPHSPVLVRGDRSCLTVLIDNLVNNAVKYNRPGGTVTVEAVDDAKEALLKVSDTGIGIAEEARGFLFDEFYRAPDAAARAPGSGLGLAICRMIAHEHGGIIQLDSAPGVGSSFTVRLPALAPTDGEEAPGA